MRSLTRRACCALSAVSVLVVALPLAMTYGGATAPAAAAENPTVPLLTGGLLRYRGTVKGEEHFRAEGVTQDAVTGPVDFDTTWLIAGGYPHTDHPPLSNWPTNADGRQVSLSNSPGTVGTSWDRTDSSGSHHCDVTEYLTPSPHQAYIPAGPPGANDGSLDVWPMRKDLTRIPDNPCAQSGVYPDWADTDSYTASAWFGSGIRQLPEHPWQATSRTVDIAPTGTSLGGFTFTLSGATGSLSCAICVSDITFKQLSDPTTGSDAKVEVPASGTYDGNVVEITATVHNAAPRTLTVPFTFVDLTTGKPLREADGTKLVEPQVLAAGATRDITFSWDSSGTAWRDQKPLLEHRIGVLTQLGGAQRTIDVLPRPVVLVHGWNSDASTWGTMKSLLRAKDDKWPVFAVGDSWSQSGMTMDTDPVSGNSLLQNARAEDRYVEHVRRLTRAQHVDLVVHSMGGLISRLYIDHLMTARPHPPGSKPLASHLVMLGTPNMGSACAYAAAGLASLFGGAVPSIQLTPAYLVDVFDRDVRNQHGVPFSVDAGTGFPVCFTGDGDTVVTRTSAWWTYSDVGEVPGDIHTELTGDPTVVDQWILPHIAKAWFEESAAPRRAARSAAPKLSDVGNQMVMLTRKSVGHGKTWRVPVKVTRSQRLDVSLVAPAGVSVKVLRPSGATAAQQKARSRAATQPFRTLRVNKPAPGRWTVVVKNTGSSSRVMLGAALDGAKVRETLDLARSGQRLKATVRFVSGSHRVTGAKVRAFVRRVGGRLVRITLHDNGKGGDARAHDGRYTGRTARLQPGDYVVLGKAVKGSLVRITTAALRVG